MVDELPTEIAGRTEDRRPGRQYAGFYNQREGINVSDAFRRVEDPDGPTLTIDVRLRTGEVRVIEP